MDLFGGEQELFLCVALIQEGRTIPTPLKKMIIIINNVFKFILIYSLYKKATTQDRTADLRITSAMHFHCAIVALRRPGIEPGAIRWKRTMFPLHQRREEVIKTTAARFELARA